MIDKEHFMPLGYFKKTNYTGSMSGLRFQLGKQETEDGETVLRALIWPGPMALAATDPEKTYYRDFAFSQEGIGEAADWLNEEYTSQKEKWDAIPFWTPQMSRDWEKSH